MAEPGKGYHTIWSWILLQVSVQVGMFGDTNGIGGNSWIYSSYILYTFIYIYYNCKRQFGSAASYFSVFRLYAFVLLCFQKKHWEDNRPYARMYCAKKHKETMKTNLCSKVMQQLCTLIVPFRCLPSQACHVQEEMKVLFPESLLVCHTVGCCGISGI